MKANYSKLTARKLINLFQLNIIVFITSIPIFTLGVTVPSALWVLRRILQENQISVGAEYRNALKSNAKSGLKIGAVIFVGIFLLLVDVFLLSSAKGANLFVILSVVCLLILLSWIAFYLLPYISENNDSLEESIKQSLLILHENFLTFVLEMLLVVCFTVAFTSSVRGLLVLTIGCLVIGAVLMLQVIDYFYQKSFAKYYQYLRLDTKNEK